ncbi:hypothetical protein JVT61DRAFT_9528 [Boletus reticuloceps]|uniref:Protein kinase domain-containing protein n=1 Tax=Boletus reticuloceps TaxID=495285 RepID=A0A8I3A565_9AGAM|nr:hypothetical protein JVT61DRAFT_9528 [Boletus reticuloceps]
MQLLTPQSQKAILSLVSQPFPTQIQTTNQLYLAETTDGKKIAVKLTHHYSYELHMFCADCGYAPKLLGFEEFRNGYFAIAMEIVTSPLLIENATGPEATQLAEQLQELVKSFHAENFVHGDSRGPNILCDGNRVKVIDFDWGGKEGEVSYPNGLLNYDLMDERNSTNMKITKADDLRVMCKTMKKLWQLECGYCRSKHP